MNGVTRDELGHRLVAGADLAGGPTSQILRGLGAIILLPYAEAVAPARAAFDAIRTLPDAEMMHLGSAVASLGTFLWDAAGRSAALEHAAKAARDTGALQALDSLLWTTALSDLWGGTVRRAVRVEELVREVRRAMGYDGENVPNVAVLAWTGTACDVVEGMAQDAARTGFGGVAASGTASLAVRDLAEGRYQSAFDRLGPLVDDPFLQATPVQYPDYVEAAARSRHPQEAATVSRLLTSLADANRSAWCRGVAERALALTSADDAEPHHRASIEALGTTGAEMDLARSHLVYGEWLRRARRRHAAGEQLHLALRHFRRSGADLFVARTTAELAALGDAGDVESAPRRSDLTTQEHTVARLAAQGRTNSEIAANLFISTNTVDYHLRKVFQKLGVSSRRQLADRLTPSAAGHTTTP
ncbi:helix-turn-helix transcriptional regulator [Xylanimonas allomyrinae]|uniref:helix-turn-helix transcriptional regulator n=1 Tax=Xylanimonas allomyrinae TaxID=2509459 RepID=UPI001FE6AB35|nr:helix-turn-helix transcriptional regulator [Xylanimonas allomyrinae]